MCGALFYCEKCVINFFCAVEEEKMSGGMNSIEAVKKKIKVLQEQAEEADERAERLQREVEKEKRTREEVRHTHPNDVLKSQAMTSRISQLFPVRWHEAALPQSCTAVHLSLWV